MSADPLCFMPESTMGGNLDTNSTQLEPDSAPTILWSRMFSRPMAVLEARLKNTVVETVVRSYAVSVLVTQTKGMLSVAKSIAAVFVPRTVSGRSQPHSMPYPMCSDAFFVDLEAGIVESYEIEGQPSQDLLVTPLRATLPSARVLYATSHHKTLNTNVDPKMDQRGAQSHKLHAHISRLTRFEGIADQDESLAPCNPVLMPTGPSQLPKKNQSSKASEDDVTSVQYPLCHEYTKPITLETLPISVKSPKVSSVPRNTQKKPAFKNYKSPNIEEILAKDLLQTPSQSHTSINAASRLDKEKLPKGSKKAKKAQKDPSVKIQGIQKNTKRAARNLTKFNAKPPKRNATISELNEDHKSQKTEHKAKKAKKAHESRFDLDEAMMDALPERAANSPNPSPKRKSESTEIQQLAEKQSKRAKKCHQTKGTEDDMMMDADPADSQIPTTALPTTPRATAMSLKRSFATPEGDGAAVSPKMAKKPKLKHEGKPPIDVCVEFEDITHLVDARMRAKEEKRQEEWEKRNAPKILKRGRCEGAATEAAEGGEKSGKKPKTAKKAEEAKSPDLRKALKRGRGSEKEAEKPKKKVKSEKD